MERRGRYGGSAGSFIFLKQRTVKIAPLKKINKPKTLEELKSEAMKVFNNLFPINSFYTENGELIENIKQIKSGALIYVSSINTENDDKTYDNKAKKIVEEVAARSPTGLKKIPRRLASYSEIKTKNDKAKTDQLDDNDKSYDEDSDFDNKQEEKLDHKEEKKDEQIQETKASEEVNEPMIHKRRKVKHATKENKEEEKLQDEEQEQQVEEEREDKNESDQPKQVEEKKNDEQETTFDELFNVFNEITGMEVSNEAKKSLSKGSKQRINLVKNCVRLEDLQACRWYKYGSEMLDSVGISQPDDVIGKEDIIKLSRYTISTHRRVLPGGTTYTMNTCVRGPEHSGVTTILSFLANEYLIDLVATGEFKKNFVVVYDSRDLLNDWDSKQLFHAMLQITIDHIKWHRPDLIASLPTIKRCIESIFEAGGKSIHISRSSQIDQTLAASLEMYATMLSSVWSNEGQFASWVKECITMPISIGKLLGFKNFTIIADDIDTVLLISTNSRAPFIGSMVSMNDVICPLLNSNSYIVSCKSFDDFDIQMRCAENTTFKRIDVISTIDSIHPEDLRTITVKFEGQNGSFTFDVSSCGGIPSFVSLWNKANIVLDEIDKIALDKGKDSPEYEEEMITGISIVEELIQTIFLSPNEGKELIVESVKRN